MPAGPLRVSNVEILHRSDFKVQKELIKVPLGDQSFLHSIFTNTAPDEGILNLTAEITLYFVSTPLTLALFH